MYTSDSEYLSIVESRKPPNFVTVPEARATAPSSISKPLARRRSAPPARKPPLAMTAATSRLSRRPIAVRRFGVNPQRARASPRRSVEFLIRAPISSEITRCCPSECAGQSRGGGGLERPVVDSEHPGGDFGPGIVAGSLLTCDGHSLSQWRICQQPDDSQCQGMRILRRRQQSFPAVRHDAAIPRNVSGNDWSARGHRFEQHDPEALSGYRGSAEEIAARVVARELLWRHQPDEIDIAHAIALHDPVEPFGLPAASDNQPGLGKLLVDRRHGAQKVLEALARLVVPAHEENAGNAVAHPGERFDTAEPVHVDAVRHDVVGTMKV